MTPYYLRATDRILLLQAAVSAGLLTVSGVPVDPVRVSWDEIGALYEPTGAVDAEGQPVTQVITNAQGVPYFHANLLLRDGELPAGLQQYQTQPSTPDRVFWL